MNLLDGFHARLIDTKRPGRVSLKRGDELIFCWFVAPLPYFDDGRYPRMPDPNLDGQGFLFDHPVWVDGDGVEVVTENCTAVLQYRTVSPITARRAEAE